MDLKEYESWLSFLKEEIAHDSIDDAATIVKDLFLNKELIENINKDITKVIAEKLSELSLKFNKIIKSKESYDKIKLEGVVDEIIKELNNLIILKKINQIISGYYTNKVNVYITVKAIDLIKKIKDVHYTHQRNFNVYFIDNTTYYINPKKNPRLSDDLAIGIFYIAAKNTGAKNSVIEISREISTKHHAVGVRKKLEEFAAEMR